MIVLNLSVVSTNLLQLIWCYFCSFVFVSDLQDIKQRICRSILCYFVLFHQFYDSSLASRPFQQASPGSVFVRLLHILRLWWSPTTHNLHKGLLNQLTCAKFLFLIAPIPAPRRCILMISAYSKMFWWPPKQTSQDTRYHCPISFSKVSKFWLTNIH